MNPLNRFDKKQENQNKLQQDFSESNYRYLFENIPQKVFYKDINSVYVAVNPSYAKDFNLLPSEFIDKNDYDFFPEHLARKYQNDDRDVMQTGLTREMEESYMHDGQLKTVHTLKAPVRNHDGDIIGILGIFWDITERKKTEKKLKETHESLLTILDSINALVYVADMESYEILFINKYGKNIWGEIVGEICWKKLQQGQTGPCQFCSNEHLLDSEGNPKGVYTWEFQNTINKSWYQIHDKAISWIDGRTVRLEIATDITHLKEAESELRKQGDYLKNLVNERTKELTEANKLLKKEIQERKWAEAEVIRASQLASLGELAAGVAHEVNNPINGIINYAQILANNSDRGSEEHDIASRIIKEGDRIANIVGSLLSFARDNKVKRESIEAAEILSDALTLTDCRLRNNGIKIKINMPQELPPFNVHRQQIEQVFLNIISNAGYALNQKYSNGDKNKILEISGETVTLTGIPHLKISFHDRGMGIPSDILDKVISPFFTTKPDGLGTGLGLSISYGIIKNHGGELEIESQEGAFTKVNLFIPCKSET